MTGDGASDLVALRLQAGVPTKVKIGADASAVTVSRARTSVRIESADPTLDSLVVNGLGALDKIVEDPDAGSLILLTVNPD